MIPTGVSGAGLGLRRELIPALLDRVPPDIAFFEVAPENWMEMGGAAGRRFRHFTERHPFVAHGLSLSLGGPRPLDEPFLRRVRRFLDEHRIALYTEHLAYTTDDGQLYDLLPIPFTGDAVRHVARRIRLAQDILERRIAIENASFYVKAPIDEMDELTFVREVLREADCALHLDVNNVYVNSVNHGYDPRAFLHALPPERVVYLHMAGHYREAPDLLVDTHGADVIDPVWELLDLAFGLFGVHPTLLERDFNIPPLPVLEREVRRIADLQARHTGAPAHRAPAGGRRHAFS
ncbi:MAG: DUF692 family protein [Betaproteobacteria bacterium]|nr:DUF692 family protein [Betaproteobacteria bacterium]